MRRISDRPLALGAGGWLLSLGLAFVGRRPAARGRGLPVVFVAAGSPRRRSARSCRSCATRASCRPGSAVTRSRPACAASCSDHRDLARPHEHRRPDADRRAARRFALVTPPAASARCGCARVRAASWSARCTPRPSCRSARASCCSWSSSTWRPTSAWTSCSARSPPAWSSASRRARARRPAARAQARRDRLRVPHPVFFITTGLTFDLDGLLGDPEAIILVPTFLVALLAVRGPPVLLYRAELGGREHLALAFYSATTLPLVVAISTIAVAGGHMPRRPRRRSSQRPCSPSCSSRSSRPSCAGAPPIAVPRRPSHSEHDPPCSDRERRPVRRPAEAGRGAGTLVLVAFLVSFLAIRTSARLTRSVSWWPGGVEPEGGLTSTTWSGDHADVLLLLSSPRRWTGRGGTSSRSASGSARGSRSTSSRSGSAWRTSSGASRAVSFDAVVCTVVFAILVVIGTRPFGLDEPTRSGGRRPPSASWRLWWTRFAKGRVLLGVIGVFLPVVAFFGAVRLAHPASIWAKRRYDDARLAKAPRTLFNPPTADDARRAATRRSHRRATDRRDREPKEE